MFVENMDKFGQKKIMKKRPFTESTWYNRLIHHIPESIKKGKCLFKTTTTEDYCRDRKEPRKPKIHKQNIEKQSEGNIIKNVKYM